MSVPNPVRIFCGADRDEQVPFRVLEYSIRRHTRLTVEARLVDNSLAPTVADPRHWPYTRFSFGRFAIPALCGHAGRAIYMDSDMLVFRDIAELWELPFDEARILIEIGGLSKREKGKQAAVMLLDCARLDWDVDRIVRGLGTDYDYNTLMSLAPLLGPGDLAERIPTGWNDLDDYDRQRTRLLHYTTIRTQPWVRPGHPHGALWTEEVRRMLAEGALAPEQIARDVAAGYLRPSLLPELGLSEGPRGDDAAALAAYDAERDFQPHAELLTRFAERKRAIARVECDEAIARRPWLAPWYRLRFRVRHGAADRVH
ncbi:MAG TPA: glycosyltransferase [Xanthomonadaceae bacterium]|nr:glycosyltransferase [Xanthomonadaceae bacterium]